MHTTLLLAAALLASATGAQAGGAKLTLAMMKKLHPYVEEAGPNQFRLLMQDQAEELGETKTINAKLDDAGDFTLRTSWEGPLLDNEYDAVNQFNNKNRFVKVVLDHETEAKKTVATLSLTQHVVYHDKAEEHEHPITTIVANCLFNFKRSLVAWHKEHKV